jgi:hypothetical protein
MGILHFSSSPVDTPFDIFTKLDSILTRKLSHYDPGVFDLSFDKLSSNLPYPKFGELHEIVLGEIKTSVKSSSRLRCNYLRGILQPLEKVDLLVLNFQSTHFDGASSLCII